MYHKNVGSPQIYIFSAIRIEIPEDGVCIFCNVCTYDCRLTNRFLNICGNAESRIQDKLEEEEQIERTYWY